MGVTTRITKREVENACKKMMNGKAVGPDETPAEAWIALGEGVELLRDLLDKISEQELIPNEWRESIVTAVYKEKGDIQECGNYRGIKLMSHTMKILERIYGNVREEVDIGKDQFGLKGEAQWLEYSVYMSNDGKV